MRNRLLVLILSVLILDACTTLKTYEMVYVNDPEMQMGESSGKSYENYIQSIREGSTPSGASKSSGGCGCN